MSSDPKFVVKDILDDYITANPIMKDNGVTPASTVVMYERGPETLKYLFTLFDVVVTVGEPTVRSQRETQDIPTHYLMRYAVTVTTVDKTSAGAVVCTASIMQGNARVRVRAAIEASAQSATGATPAYVLTIMEERGKNSWVAGLDLWETTYYIEYITG